MPLAHKGILDLSRWDLASQGPVRLSGEWEFYYMKFIPPENFIRGTAPAPDSCIPVPLFWNKFKLEGEKLPVDGFATYRLIVQTGKKYGGLALRFKDRSAYSIYVNGRLLGSVGAPGTSRKESIARYATTNIIIPSEWITPAVEIVIHVSNYHFRNGGIHNPIEFGAPEGIYSQHRRGLIADFFLFGSILIMGLYHLGLYLLRRKDRSPLYFALFCLGIGLRTMVYGEVALALYFPNAPYDLMYGIDYFTFCFSLMMLSMYVYSLFPDEYKRIPFRIITVLGSLYSIFALVTPARISSLTMPSYQIIFFVFGLYGIYAVILALHRKREGAAVFLTGLLILFATSINDILNLQKKISTGLYMDAALFIFFFSQSFLISKRFSNAFFSVERLLNTVAEKSGDLEKANVELVGLHGNVLKMQMYLKNIIDSMPSVLISVDADGRISEWNQAAAEMTGISSPQATGRFFWDIAPFVADYRENCMEVVKSMIPQKFMRQPYKNGVIKYHDVTLFPLTTNGVGGVVIRVDDSTEIEKKEMQLRQAQKMETLGVLAGGLAHDLNNILGGITGPLSLIKFSMAPGEKISDEEMTDYLTTMEESAGRATDIVRQLLTMSRKQELDLVRVDLNLTVRHVMKICSSSFDKTIELAVNYFEKPAMVSADLTQIEQALLNLCVNASHAMTIMRKEGEPQGGKLSVSIDYFMADESFCSTHPEAQLGAYWVLSVRDTGVGMDAKTVAKIFDPFFTTKAKEKGTGLGMAMVYNIVHSFKGFIDVYTEPGSGSAFNVYLRALEMGSEKEGLVSSKAIPTGKGLILIVDDEAIMRLTARKILEKCGYDVVEASDGEEGVGIFRLRQQEIKAVLLDMAMPKMNGQLACTEMRRINPCARIIISSGFSRDERINETIRNGAADFIQKPYTLARLAVIIDSVVNN